VTFDAQNLTDAKVVQYDNDLSHPGDLRQRTRLLRGVKLSSEASL